MNCTVCEENLIAVCRSVGREGSTEPANVYDMTVDIASRWSFYSLWSFQKAGHGSVAKVWQPEEQPFNPFCPIGTGNEPKNILEKFHFIVTYQKDINGWTNH